MHRLTRCSLITLSSSSQSTPILLSPLPRPSVRSRLHRHVIATSRRPQFIAGRVSSSYSSVPSRMDSSPPESENPPAASAADDYVSVEDPASIESLVESIVTVVDEEEVVEREGGDAEEVVDREGGDAEEAVMLPEELSRSVVELTCASRAEGGVCHVYLVGTAHVSQESCQEVQAVINILKPQVVFLELCSSRVSVLTPQNLKVPTMREMVDIWKKQHNLFGILYSWFLAKVANKLEVFPGAEFRVAFDEAMKYGGKVVLGDRPVQITLRRTWAKMPCWHKIKLVYSLLFQAVFLPSPEDLNKMLKEMDDVDMLTLVIQEMSKQFPTLMETLVHERDQYMSSILFKVASDHNSVVAVVGKGHLHGIKKNWEQPVELKDLLHVDLPSEKKSFSTLKILTTFGVAIAGAAIVSGLYISSKK